MRAVLGRPAIGYDETAVGQPLEMVLPELAGLLEDRIGGLVQIIAIAAERVVLPEVQAVPGVGRFVPLPAQAARRIVRRPHRPAAHRPRCLELGGGLGCFPPGLKLTGDEIDQGQMALGQVRRLRGPVVHLNVDVHVVVAVPGWRIAVVPQSLQIGGQSGPSRRGDQQVAAVVEQQRFELRVFAAAGVARQPLVGRQSGQLDGRLAKREPDAVEQALVVANMPLQKFLE